MLLSFFDSNIGLQKPIEVVYDTDKSGSISIFVYAVSVRGLGVISIDRASGYQQQADQ